MTVFLMIAMQMFFTYIRYSTICTPGNDITPMLVNPIFIALLLTILGYGEYLFRDMIDNRFMPQKQDITFTSGYRKVTISPDSILYIESRDSEVAVITKDGQEYRNRTGITQWENLLGDKFLRIHRSFLVNASESVLSSCSTVTIGGKQLPVSRKYKDCVKNVLSQMQD